MWTSAIPRSMNGFIILSTQECFWTYLCMWFWSLLSVEEKAWSTMHCYEKVDFGAIFLGTSWCNKIYKNCFNKFKSMTVHSKFEVSYVQSTIFDALNSNANKFCDINQIILQNCKDLAGRVTFSGYQTW